MSLADARAAWRLARERIAAGEDPGKTQEPSGAGEFGAVAAEWLKRDQAGNKSYTDVQRLLEVDVLPHWRHRRVEDIGRKDVLELIDGVADRGSPVMARRLHAHLHRLFEWSVGRGIIVANPLWSVPKVGNETPRDQDQQLIDRTERPADLTCGLPDFGKLGVTQNTITRGLVAHLGDGP